MAGRLYPGYGTGKKPYEGHFEARSYQSAGRPDLETGDKITLPTSAFKEITRLKLAMPLVFRAQNERLKTAGTVPSKDGKLPKERPEQYAGIVEFSAPEGTALMPKWMMENLGLRDGGKLQLNTIHTLPAATYVKLRPHSLEFVELAAAIGPRELLEMAMRNYSALSVGERFIVDLGEGAPPHALDVLELKPAKAVSLYGNIDLEVDFAPIKGSKEDLEQQAAAAAASGGPSSSPKSQPLSSKPAMANAAAVTTAAAAAAAAAAATGGKKPAVSPVDAKKAAASSPGRSPGGAARAAAAVAAAASGPGSPGRGTPKRVTAAASQAGKTGASATKAAAAAISAAAAAATAADFDFDGPMVPTFGSGAFGGFGSNGVDPFSVPMVPFLAAPAAAAAASAAAALAPAPLAPSLSSGSSGSGGGGYMLGSTLSGDSGNISSGMLGAAAPAPVPAPAKAGPTPEERAAAAAMRAQAAMARLARQASQEGAPPPPAASASAATAATTAPAPAVTSPLRSSVQDGWLSAAARERKLAELTGGPGALSPGRFGSNGNSGSGASDRKWAEEEEKDARGSGIAAVRAARESKLDDDAPAASASVPSSPPAVVTRPCSFCLSDVPVSSWDVHVLRCERNKAYHKTSCGTCGAVLLNKDAPRHLHCASCADVIEVPLPLTGTTPIGPAEQEAARKAHEVMCRLRMVPCDCGVAISAPELSAHKTTCPAVLLACKYCRVKFKRVNLPAHEDRCGSRTGACEACNKLVVLKHMEAHLATTCPVLHPPPAPPPAPAAAEGKDAEHEDEDEQDAGEGKTADDADYESKAGEGKAGEDEEDEADAAVARIGRQLQFASPSKGKAKPASRMTAEDGVEEDDTAEAMSGLVRGALATGVARITSAAAAAAAASSGTGKGSSSKAALHSSSMAHSAAATATLGSALGLNGSAAAVRGKAPGGSSSTASAIARPSSSGSVPTATTTSSSKTAAAAKGSAAAAAPGASARGAAALGVAGSTLARQTSAPAAAAAAASAATKTSKTTTTTSSAGSGISRRGAFPCPHCKAGCLDYEDLQMHIFTACSAAGNIDGPPAAAAPAAAAPAPAPAQAAASKTAARTSLGGSAAASKSSTSANTTTRVPSRGGSGAAPAPSRFK